jgi:peptidoglycan/LPS O-acetylase OafA/YrhL
MSTTSGHTGAGRLGWIEPVKALALLAIILNHFVECFGDGPWFTNPSRDWPDLATRLGQIYPTQYRFPLSFVQFLGWLGDSAPGVFILLSGLGLTLDADRRGSIQGWVADFYRRRLSRIFPLYIAMHFVILTLAVAVGSDELVFRGPRVLLSLLGLRFQDSLFYFISPSWWFVWLVIQLYVVFPLLYKGLERFGVTRFLIGTVVLTVASRFAGFWYPGNVYTWMTGLFFGSRLAEFTVGMVLARGWASARDGVDHSPPLRKLLPGSALVYGVGLACSWTYAGSLVANFLVTLGMTGLFYSACLIVGRPLPRLTSALCWLGVNSYAIFLLHQPPMQWASSLRSLPVWGKVLATLIVILISFPAARLISEVVARLVKAACDASIERLWTWAARLSALVVLAVLTRDDPFALWKIKLWYLVLAGATLTLLIEEWRNQGVERRLDALLRRTALVAGLIKLFLLGPQASALLLAPIVGVLSAVEVGLLEGFRWRRSRAWAASALLGLMLFGSVELALRRYSPLETAVWGELPALETHPTRVYGLRPNRVTHLRYNNYDYVVRTNSLGLPGPEVPIERPAADTLRVLVIGDAFTMPEGVKSEDAYPALLEKSLAEKYAPGRVEVINAGVTGYGPVEELAQLRELVPLLKPDLILYEFFINEFEEISLSPEDRLDGIGLGARRPSFIERAQLPHHATALRWRLSEWATGRPASYRYAKALLAFYEKETSPHYSPETLSLLESHLGQMKSIADQNRSRFVVCFVPGAVAVSKPSDIHYFPWDVELSDEHKFDMEKPLKNLKKVAGGLAIPVLDLTPRLKSHPIQPVYFPGSWHWNPEGHRAVAASIASFLDSDKGIAVESKK